MMFRIHLMIMAFSLSHVICDASEYSGFPSYSHLLKEELVAWIKDEINKADTKDDRLEYPDMIGAFYYSHFDQLTQELLRALYAIRMQGSFSFNCPIAGIL